MPGRRLPGLAIVLALTTYVLLRLDLGQLGTAWHAMLGKPRHRARDGGGLHAGVLAARHRLADAAHDPAASGRLFSILQAGLFLNHLLPFKAGEVARPYLATRHGVPAAEAATTTVVARLATSRPWR